MMFNTNKINKPSLNSSSIIIYFFIFLWVFLAAFPFIWTFWGSIKVELDFFSIANWTNAITGEKIWKTLSINDNILISTTAYGFSKKKSNYKSFNELEIKLNRVVYSIEIRKINRSSST